MLYNNTPPSRPTSPRVHALPPSSHLLRGRARYGMVQYCTPSTSTAQLPLRTAAATLPSSPSRPHEPPRPLAPSLRAAVESIPGPVCTRVRPAHYWAVGARSISDRPDPRGKSPRQGYDDDNAREVTCPHTHTRPRVTCPPRSPQRCCMRRCRARPALRREASCSTSCNAVRRYGRESVPRTPLGTW